jgi:large subunit ribosomal protein L10
MEEEVFDAKGVEALSKMPSREELIATIAARLLGQAGEIVSRINAPGATLAGQIETIGEQAAS